MQRGDLRVLLLEDSPGDADLIFELLDEVRPRLAVEHAETLGEALECVAAQGFDAVLLDLSLPDSDGLETFEKWSNQAPDVPVVVLTGLDDEEFAEETVRRGAQDYLVKGRVDGHLILRTVRYAIERQRLMRDLSRQVEEVRAAEARLKQLIEKNVDGMVILDPEGKLRFVNPAAEALFGRSQGGLLGTVFEPPPIRLGASEVEIPGPDGSVVVAEMRVVETTWDGEPAYLASLRDISDRRQLEEQLVQAQKMEAVGQLAGGVAHDFNNLLTVIIASTEQVLSGTEPQHPTMRPAEAVLHAAEQAAALTRQLLTFSRKQMRAPEAVNLNRIVEGTEQLLHPILRENVELVTRLAPQLASVEADYGQIQQVIVNLAANARDAMSEGGTLSIETADVDVDASFAADHEPMFPGQYVRLTVSDSGCGMERPTQQRIFEPFYTTKGVGQGTGLGLSIVYGIVKQSRGYVWVYSEVGHGTTFKIYLPAVGAPAVVDEGDESAPPRGAETILLVEDTPEVRFVTRSILEALGYAVLDAPGGTEALKILAARSEAVDLVITDVVMPRMSGTELAKRVARKHPRTPVLFISGYPGGATRGHDLEVPGSSFLEKPFTQRQLALKVRGILNARGR